VDVAIGTAEGRTPTPPRRPPTPQDSEPPKALYVSSIRKDDSVATEEGEDDSLIAILSAAVREQTKISKRVNFAPIPKRPSEVSPSRRVAVDVALHSAAPSRGSAKPKRAKKVEVRRKGNAGANGRARRPQDARAQNGA